MDIEAKTSLKQMTSNSTGLPTYTRSAATVFASFLKLRLSGDSPGDGGPSFGGLMFDTDFEPRPHPKGRLDFRAIGDEAPAVCQEVATIARIRSP